MRKVIIFLSGTAQKDFVDLARKENYWVWNCGIKDCDVSSHPRVREWNARTNEDLEINDYVLWVVESFGRHEYSNILFINNYTEEQRISIDGNYECYYLNIREKDFVLDSDFNYDVLLSRNDQDFKEKSINILSILTKD
jgi:hypothetical protein